MKNFIPSDNYLKITTIDSHTAGEPFEKDLGFLYGTIFVDTPDIVINSIINTSFTGQVEQQTQVENYKAIIPKVTGSAYITGVHEFLIDPDDPLNQGFILR